MGAGGASVGQPWVAAMAVGLGEGWGLVCAAQTAQLGQPRGWMSMKLQVLLCQSQRHLDSLEL